MPRRKWDARTKALIVLQGLKGTPVSTLYALRYTSATDWLDAAAARRWDVLPYVQRQLGDESLESTAIELHCKLHRRVSHVDSRINR